MDRNMSRMLRTVALLLAVTVTPAVASTATVPTQDLGSSTSSGSQGMLISPDGPIASGRSIIDPNGLTNSGSGRMLIDPDGRV